MSAYLEFHVKGGGCAIIEAGMIGAVMAKGHDAWRVGTPDAPTLVVLRSGEQIEVIGSSPGGVIGRLVSTRQLEREMKMLKNAEVYVDWLAPMTADDADAADSRHPRP